MSFHKDFDIEMIDTKFYFLLRDCKDTNMAGPYDTAEEARLSAEYAVGLSPDDRPIWVELQNIECNDSISKRLHSTVRDIIGDAETYLCEYTADRKNAGGMRNNLSYSGRFNDSHSALKVLSTLIKFTCRSEQRRIEEQIKSAGFTLYPR